MKVQFESPAQQECYEVVQDYLALLDLDFETAEHAPQLSVRLPGPVTVRLTVIEWKEDEAAVALLSWLVRDVRPTRDLLLHLLRENYRLLMGAFAIDDDNDVCITHMLGGTELDKSELRDAIMTITLHVNHYRPRLVNAFGGSAV